MLWKPQELTIDPEDPFTHDALDREAHVKNVANLLINSSGSVVLAVDGVWGSGKTTFLRFLNAVLENEGRPTIMFNAWDVDFVEDPLIALLAEINETAEEKAPSEAADAVSNAKRYGGHLLRRGVPLIIKLASHGLIDLTDADEAIGTLIQEAGENASEVIDAHIRDYEEARNSLEGFRNALREMAEAVGDSEEYTLPLVFFIDELDRSRPDFALATLERIKHAFAVPGVSFVLGMNHDQLARSIQGAYGSTFDGRRYLDRLIDLRYELPSPEPQKFLANAFSASGLSDIFSRRGGAEEHLGCRVTLSAIADIVPSWRVLGKIVARLSLVLRVTNNRTRLNVPLLTLFVALRNLHPELYQDFVSARAGAEDVWRYLEVATDELEFDHNVGVFLRASLYRSSGVEGELKNYTESLRRQFDNRVDEGAKSDPRVTELRQELRLLDDPTGTSREGFHLLIDRIELARQFSGVSAS